MTINGRAVEISCPSRNTPSWALGEYAIAGAKEAVMKGKVAVTLVVPVRVTCRGMFPPDWMNEAFEQAQWAVSKATAARTGALT